MKWKIIVELCTAGGELAHSLCSSTPAYVRTYDRAEGRQAVAYLCPVIFKRSHTVAHAYEHRYKASWKCDRTQAPAAVRLSAINDVRSMLVNYA